MSELAAWLEATSLSKTINTYPWLWPASETLHFIGLALLIGTAGAFDLRLMGFLRGIPIAAVREFLPWARVGFAINALTGAVFFVGMPYQYVGNVAFLGKIIFVLVAGANAMVFETQFGERLTALGDGEDTPWSFKIIGGLSLLSWMMVLFFGRMLPFIGNSF